MRGLGAFIGANLFLLGMLLAGLAAVVGLVRLAQLAGADDDVMRWLYWPIGLVGIIACYYTGKALHQLIARAL
jgi:bacteriorhodopsin